MRTTIDLDPAILNELRRRQRQEHKTLGQIASELLARALAADRASEQLPPLKWASKPLGLKIDLEDKEELWRILDER